MPEKNAIRIRPLRIADYESAHAIWRKAPGVGVNESDSRAGIGQFLRRNPGLSLVATSGGRVIGTVLCGHDGRRGYLHHLAIARPWQRRGIGRRLVSSCLENLRVEGIPKCSLFIFRTNISGKAFWKSLGWTVRGDLQIVQHGTPGHAPAAHRSC
jgi:ribosomal protein S18 acetylase RimI-like enzyme